MLLLIYVIAAVIAGVGFLLACRGFDVIDDLLDDLRNPTDACNILNSLILCDWAFQLCSTFLFIWQPVLYIWNLAMVFFDGWQWARRGSDLTGSWWTQYDPKRIPRQASCIWYIQLGKCIYYGISITICCILIGINLFYGSSS